MMRIWGHFGDSLVFFLSPQFLKSCLILLTVVAEFICWSVDLTEAESQKLKNECGRGSCLVFREVSVSDWWHPSKSSLAQKTLVIPPGFRTLAGMRSAERETWTPHPRQFPNRPLTAHCSTSPSTLLQILSCFFPWPKNIYFYFL